MIEVVSGVIIAAGRILLTQRPYGKDFAYAWESPGGKVDAGESHHAALRRELDEEIGVAVGPIPERPFWIGEFRNPTVRADRAHVLVHFYLVNMVRQPEVTRSGAPSPREGQGIGWFMPEEMGALCLAPANASARHIVAGYMGGS